MNIAGSTNAADVLTKCSSAPTLTLFLGCVLAAFEHGRSSFAGRGGVSVSDSYPADGADCGELLAFGQPILQSHDTHYLGN